MPSLAPGSRIKVRMPTRPSVRVEQPTSITTRLSSPAVAWRQALAAEVAAILSAKAWAKDPDTLVVGACSYDAGLLTEAEVVWPDGATGVLTITSRQDDTDAVTGYTITHVLDEVTLTYTQPTITRDEDGNVTDVPQITVA